MTMKLLQACGSDSCDGATFEDNDSDVPKASYLSMMSTSLLSILAPTLAASTNNTLQSLVQFADYLSCMCCYLLLCIAMMIVHTLLRELHSPTVVHQLFNATVILLFLAQNPSSWIVVTRNLEVYCGWLMIQGLVALASFALVLTLYLKTRNHILHLQDKQRDNVADQSTAQKCKVGKMLARLDDLRWIVSIVPPLLMGGLVLIGTEARS
jgi:hypothetical protein